jgi:hypothetical protein
MYTITPLISLDRKPTIMKIASTLAFVFLLGPLNNAQPQISEWSMTDWRDNALELLESRSNLEGHLLSGVWKPAGAQDESMRRVMQFSPNGKASQLIQRSDGRYDHRLLSWALHTREEQAILYLTSSDQGSQQYLIDASAEQIKLVEINSYQSVWASGHSGLTNADIARKVQELTGAWENVTYDLNAELPDGRTLLLDHAIISYKLKADGAYVRALYRPGEEQPICRESGRWELSKDAQLIFFHPDAGGRVTCAKIEWLAMDELVLEQNRPFTKPADA